MLSATQIAAVAPSRPDGPVAVTVSTPGGTSNGVVYTYLAAPAIAAVYPDQAPASGGSTAVLNGTGFTGVTAVRFGTATPPFTVISDTLIRVTVPAGTGVVDVTVTASGGTSNSVPFTYLRA